MPCCVDICPASCTYAYQLQSIKNAASSGKLLGVVLWVVLLLEQPGRVERARNKRCMPQHRSTRVSSANASRMSPKGGLPYSPGSSWPTCTCYLHCELQSWQNLSAL